MGPADLRAAIGRAVTAGGTCPMCPPDGGRAEAGRISGRGPAAGDPGRVALVGAPNVGKSTLFHRLTGRYVTVSNYPRTSVEVTHGEGEIGGRPLRVVDTPGLYSLSAVSEEEEVARRLVCGDGVDVLVHVIEARCVRRSLPLTLELLELGRPLVVVLNMMDELGPLGLEVDTARLAERLGVDVVPLVAVSGEGLAGLGAALERALEAGGSDGPASGPTPGASVAGAAPREARPEPADAYGRAVARREAGDRLLADVVRSDGRRRARVADRLGRWLARPFPGIPVLLVVLWLGLYEFVGHFGAGTLVDWIEGTVFLGHVNPFLERLFSGIPWPWARSLWVGDYGLLTLGLRYAIAIILPIVGTFFLFFSVLEDSGYLPRLALLVDRPFKRLGLNGRAVIPIVLGLACDTMATMVTRTLDTKRERILATVLLALAIPCSAQLGVILAILSGRPLALGIWAGVLLASFLLIGVVGNLILPGRSASFHMELPPLRLPRAANVARKTLSRLHWYMLEVIPLFLLPSVLLWAGEITGLLGRILGGLEPVVGALGLPARTASVFLLGFFRRDYGAAGLYELQRTGALDTVSLAVAAVTLTLFVPCIAQFLMMWKERGPKLAAAVFAFASLFAFGVGFILNAALRGAGL